MHSSGGIWSPGLFALRRLYPEDPIELTFEGNGNKTIVEWTAYFNNPRADAIDIPVPFANVEEFNTLICKRSDDEMEDLINPEGSTLKTRNTPPTLLKRKTTGYYPANIDLGTEGREIWSYVKDNNTMVLVVSAFSSSITGANSNNLESMREFLKSVAKVIQTAKDSGIERLVTCDGALLSRP